MTWYKDRQQGDKLVLPYSRFFTVQLMLPSNMRLIFHELTSHFFQVSLLKNCQWLPLSYQAKLYFFLGGGHLPNLS